MSVAFGFAGLGDSAFNFSFGDVFGFGFSTASFFFVGAVFGSTVINRVMSIRSLGPSVCFQISDMIKHFHF